MTRNVAWLLLLAVVAVPAFAGSNSGSVSGYVKNSAGVPQMGASVQIFAPGVVATTVFTDSTGFFNAATLVSGVYHVKVTAPSFLPSLRENVNIRSGANMVVNVTLNTLYEAIQFTPARKRAGDDEEDWKFTLRNMASRPVLRIVDDGPVVVSRSEKDEDKVLRAKVAFIAGAEAEGSSGAAGSTVFDIDTSMFSSGKLNLNGNVAYNGQSTPATVLRAAYSKQLANGSTPEIAFTGRRFALPFDGQHSAALQALALSVADDFTLLDVAEMKLGTEYQTIEMFGRADAFKPFADLDLHLGHDTTLSYGYATTQPTMRAAKGFDTAPADLSESGPRMSLQNFNTQIERARHHEVALKHRLGSNTTLLAAAYDDSFTDPAVIGVGDPDTTSGAFLPDLYSGTFSFTGRTFHTNGVRVAAERKLADVTATMDYSYGGALDLPAYTPAANAQAAMQKVSRHTLGCKVAGSVPVTHTRWIASYRWTNGPSITPVDSFNGSIGQMDPYMNVFVRQPVPTLGFLPKMEALVDVRNLLAQGYTPIIGSDGRMLYLVQTARAVRGGVSFSF
jgi:hypothetical protein